MVGMGFLGSAPFVLSIDIASGILDAAKAIVEITIGRERHDVRGRLLMLDAMGSNQEAFSKVFLLLGAALPAWLLAQPIAQGIGESQVLGVKDWHPAGATSALLLSAVVIWFLSRALATTQRLARRIVDEVRRQRQGRRRDSPDVEMTPCLDIGSRVALQHTAASAVLVTTLPVCVFGLIRTLYGAQLSSVAISVGIIATTLFFSMGATLLTLAAATWSAARKQLQLGPQSNLQQQTEDGQLSEAPASLGTLTGDTVGDFCKDIVQPLTLLLITFLPLLALAGAPFLR